MARLPRPGRLWSRRWTVVAAIAGVAGGTVLLRGFLDPLGAGAFAVAVGCAIAISAKLVGRLWTWVAVMTGFGLLVGVAPLFNVLGYELALATTVLAAPLGLDLGSAYARELARAPVSDKGGVFPVSALARSTLTAMALVAGLLLIPAAIAAARGIW
ncbi:MAG: hypothetical protein SFX73_22715, partial [Kofleriaceae bacterium]|nr:hypothetical protein [Kofleriaceae bacterium]